MTYEVIMRFLWVVLSLFCITLSSCEKSQPTTSITTLLEGRLGVKTFQLINTAEGITFSNFRTPEGFSKQLTDEQVTKLKQILISDSSYIFDRMKKCLFIPDGGTFTFFKGDQSLTAVLSIACKQLKITLPEGKVIILEVDPSFDKLTKLITEITK